MNNIEHIEKLDQDTNNINLEINDNINSKNKINELNNLYNHVNNMIIDY